MKFQGFTCTCTVRAMGIWIEYLEPLSVLCIDISTYLLYNCTWLYWRLEQHCEFTELTKQPGLKRLL